MTTILLELPILPFFLSFGGRSKLKLSIYLIAFLAFLIGSLIIQKKKSIQPQISIQHPTTVIMISLLFFAIFYQRWNGSIHTRHAAKILKLTEQQTCMMFGLFLILLSLSGIDHTITLLHACFSKAKTFKNQRIKPEIFIIIFIFLTALTFMFLNSECSPLYVFNDWLDPNTIFTLGKGVLKGYVPYRDLYEQKGPLLIFLHTIGAAMSFDTFLGIWLLEILACFAFIYFSYKTLKLFVGKKAVAVIPLEAFAVYSCQAFRTGDSAEEFVIALLSYAFYVGAKRIIERDIPSTREFLFIGLTSGCVFWIKYSLTGFYLGWFLVFFIHAFRNKKLKKIGQGILQIIAGIIIVTIPVFIYFSVNSALNDLFRVYFYENLFYYGNKRLNFFSKMGVGIDIFWRFSPVLLVTFVLGIMWFIQHKKWYHLGYLIITFLPAFILINIGGIYHIYTSLLLSPFSVFGFLWVFDIFKRFSIIRNSFYKPLPGISAHFFIISLMLLCRFSHNIYYLQYKKEDLFQFQLKEIIENSNIENPNILQYHVGDIGINTITGLIPRNRFFCMFNNAGIKIEEEQNKCIENKCADFILTISIEEDDHPVFQTYDYRGWVRGKLENRLHYCHYFTPKTSNSE